MCNFYKYKLIPQNYLAEDILIGIILIYPTIINKTKNLITPNIFLVENNKFIYSKFLTEENTNFVNLLNEIKYTKTSEEDSYVNYMIHLMKKGQAFISYNDTNNYIENIIEILKRKYIKRLFIQLGYNIIQLGYATRLNNNHAYSKLVQYTNNIGKEIQNQQNNKVSDIKEFISSKLIDARLEKISTNYIFKNKTIRSGLINLDKIILSLPNGNLIIVAGRPSIGKTSFSINIAYNCFLKSNINLLIFSLEMTSHQIFDKFINISSEVKLEQKTIKNINNTKWKKVSKICSKLLKQNIYINETPNLSIKQIELISNELKQNQFIELIIIDYLQLIEASSIHKTINTRNQEIGYITRKLKLLAQYLRIPIIVISQLNRNIESRTTKEPLLSDLKESGCISINTKISYFRISEFILSTKLLNLVKKKINIFYSNEEKDIISVLNKNIFNCYIRNKQIYFTQNHKILHKNSWIKLGDITQTINIFKNIIIKNQYRIKLKQYFKYISFCSFNRTYDIHLNNKFNFKANKIIIHNSIEQDADIIMILYEAKSTENETTEEKNKIIDLKISKNRNGQTGYCKLKFELYTNVFKDV